MTSGYYYRTSRGSSSSSSFYPKIPRSNIRQARYIYGSIRREDSLLGKDIRKQDFRDAESQSLRLQSDASNEASEDRRLVASQGIRAQSITAKQNSKRIGRETRERARTRKNVSRAMKSTIRSEKNRIRSQRKQERYKEKLKKLSGKGSRSETAPKSTFIPIAGVESK